MQLTKHLPEQSLVSSDDEPEDAALRAPRDVLPRHFIAGPQENGEDAKAADVVFGVGDAV